MNNQDELQPSDESINELLDAGYIKMVGLNAQGEVLYDVTEEGKKYLKKLKEGLKNNDSSI